MNAKEEVLNKVPDAILCQVPKNEPPTEYDGKWCVTSEKLDISLGIGGNKQIAWERAKNTAESIVILPCGVAIRDDRELGLGLSVLSNGIKNYCRLGIGTGKDKKYFFYISTKGIWLDPCDITDYIADLQLLKQACIEANEYFGGEYERD